MSNEQDLKTVEISIEQAEEAIEVAEALKRLHNNKDFQKVIVEGFFKEEASRVVILRADPEMLADEHQKQVNDIITSIGGLYGYFRKIYGVANQAYASLVADQETRGDILEEQLEEGTIQ